MDWIELFKILCASPLVDFLSDEELVEVAEYLKSTYLG